MSPWNLELTYLAWEALYDTQQVSKIQTEAPQQESHGELCSLYTIQMLKCNSPQFVKPGLGLHLTREKPVGFLLFIYFFHLIHTKAQFALSSSWTLVRCDVTEVT